MAANLLALVAQTLILLLTVPILSKAYGATGFGIWLIFYTVPAYLAMSDLGMITAATSEMAILWARKDEPKMLAVFQTLALTVATVGGLFTLLLSSVVLLTFGWTTLWPEELEPHLMLIPIFACYAVLALLSGVPIAALRASGYFARGTMLLESSTFLEGLAMLTTATLTGNMTYAGLAMLLIRICTLPLMYWQMRRIRPNLYFGISHASKAELRRLLPPALGVLTIPGSIALGLQGTSLIVGAMLGPAAVAVFVAVRTAARFIVQFVGMIVRAILPELAAAHGRGDKAAEQRYWRLFNRMRGLTLLPASLLFGAAGKWVVQVWSGGTLDPSFELVAVMAMGQIAHGMWFLDFYMLTATHRHVKIARPILLGSLLGLGLTAIAIKLGGLVGAAISLLVIDLLLSTIVRRYSRRV